MSTRKAEIRALLLQRRALEGLREARGRLPKPLGDYLRLLVNATVGFGLLTALIGWLSPAEPLYLLPTLALLFSGQAASYTVRLQRDPTFKVPSCGCGGGVPDDTATVLRSQEGKFLGIPSSFLGVTLYSALLGAVAADQAMAVLGLAAAAAVVSAYFGYVMVIRLESVCSLCVNVAALNLLILFHLAF